MRMVNGLGLRRFSRFGAQGFALGLIVLFSSHLFAGPPSSESRERMRRLEVKSVGDDMVTDALVEPAAQVSAISQDAIFRRIFVSAGGGHVSGAGEPGLLVYSNTQGQIVLGAVAGTRMADDIALAAVRGCPLDRYLTRVSGDRGSGADLETPYSVTLALYPSCPGASTTAAPIAGTHVTVDLPDGGLYEIEVVVASGVDIPLPASFFLATTFSRVNAGVVAGAPSTRGFSCDRLDLPGFPCAGALGGYPPGPHGSFFCRVYVRPGCPSGFPAYRVTGDGPPVSANLGRYYADFLHLVVPDCQLIGYEVAIKGDCATCAGAVESSLHLTLDNEDPSRGGDIPGTRAQAYIFGEGRVMLRKELAQPIAVPEDFWIVLHSSSGVVGPVAVGADPCLGMYDSSIARYVGAPPTGSWETFVPPWPYGVLHAAVWCAGDPPAGACCDARFGDERGDPVCRQSAQMNCLGNRWVEERTCRPDTFTPACGLGACCTPDDTCELLTQSECAALSPPGDEVTWALDTPCENVENACPFYVCRNGHGDCAMAQEEPGCWFESTCTTVCEADPYCCRFAWDEVCVRLMQDLRPISPFNDQCFSSAGGHGAMTLNVGDTAVISNARAGLTSPSPFCCGHLPGQSASGDIWFKFVATETSARIVHRPADREVIQRLERGILKAEHLVDRIIKKTADARRPDAGRFRF